VVAMGEMIKVGMADLKACKLPDALTTLGLGSCVGVCLFDPVTKVSGMAHVMLPDSKQITRAQTNPMKFADTGIDMLIREMISLGAVKSRLKAKIAGGAQMFAFNGTSSAIGRVGDRNVEAVKAKLKQIGIPIIAEDTGANYGRTIEFYSEDARLKIRAVGKPPKTI